VGPDPCDPALRAPAVVCPVCVSVPKDAVPPGNGSSSEAEEAPPRNEDPRPPGARGDDSGANAPMCCACACIISCWNCAICAICSWDIHPAPGLGLGPPWPIGGAPSWGGTPPPPTPPAAPGPALPGPGPLPGPFVVPIMCACICAICMAYSAPCAYAKEPGSPP
jgi:hypothetical protein